MRINKSREGGRAQVENMFSPPFPHYRSLFFPIPIIQDLEGETITL
jgi:hypothetical protein